MTILAAALEPDAAAVRDVPLAEQDPVVPLDGVAVPVLEQMARGREEDLVAGALVAGSEHGEVEAGLRRARIAAGGVLQREPEPTAVGAGGFEADDLAPGDDAVLPFALVGLVQALAVHVLVHAVEELGPHDAVVGAFVAGVGFPAGVGGEVVEGVDAVGVEDFVHAGGKVGGAVSIVRVGYGLWGENPQGTVVAGF